MSDKHFDDPLYRDGRHYDLQNAGLTADIPFYLRQAKRSGGPVLELACGTGRITIPIARNGFDVTGIDRSEGMLARAREKSAGQDLPITWLSGDIREFQFRGRFNLIMLPFNSLAHLLDLSSVNACFGAVAGHLEPQGRFVLDFFNPDIHFLLPNAPPRQVAEYPDPDSGQSVLIHETCHYDAASQINHILWHYIIGERRFSCALNMRIFFPQELDALLAHNGFEILDKYGNFDESAFTSGSPKQVIVCRLKS